VTVDEVRALALGLPRSTEAVVRGRLKFRVGRIVYLAFSADETQMGFAFPKEWRDVVLHAEPHKFVRPSRGDLRYNWLEVRLEALDAPEMRDLVVDAWRLCVPKRLAATWSPPPAPASSPPEPVPPPSHAA
jgi:hypothetical protein